MEPTKKNEVFMKKLQNSEAKLSENSDLKKTTVVFKDATQQMTEVSMENGGKIDDDNSSELSMKFKDFDPTIMIKLETTNGSIIEDHLEREEIENAIEQVQGLKDISNDTPHNDGDHYKTEDSALFHDANSTLLPSENTSKSTEVDFFLAEEQFSPADPAVFDRDFLNDNFDTPKTKNPNLAITTEQQRHSFEALTSIIGKMQKLDLSSQQLHQVHSENQADWQKSEQAQMSHQGVNIATEQDQVEKKDDTSQQNSRNSKQSADDFKEDNRQETQESAHDKSENVVSDDFKDNKKKQQIVKCEENPVEKLHEEEKLRPENEKNVQDFHNESKELLAKVEIEIDNLDEKPQKTMQTIPNDHSDKKSENLSSFKDATPENRLATLNTIDESDLVFFDNAAILQENYKYSRTDQVNGDVNSKTITKTGKKTDQNLPEVPAFKLETLPNVQQNTTVQSCNFEDDDQRLSSSNAIEFDDGNSPFDRKNQLNRTWTRNDSFPMKTPVSSLSTGNCARSPIAISATTTTTATATATTVGRKRMDTTESGSISNVNDDFESVILAAKKTEGADCKLIDTIVCDLKSKFNSVLLKKERTWSHRQQKWNEERESMQNNLKIVGNEVEIAKKSTSELSLVVSEYEKTMSQLMKQMDGNKRSKIVDFENILNEKTQLLEEVQSWENSFCELHKRYEKLRTGTDELKKNEGMLKNSVDDYKSKLCKYENRFDKLKEHAEDKLENANQEIERLIRARESDTVALRAKLKQRDVQVETLERNLEAKQREIQELTRICDDLIQKAGLENQSDTEA